MDPTCLSEEEVSYELALRHVNNLGSISRRIRAVKLRALMQEDDIKGNVYADSSHVMMPEDNIAQCLTRVREITASLDLAFKQGNMETIREARSRLLHYRDRLAIIDAPQALNDTYTTLSLLVQFSLEDIDDALGRSRKQKVVQNSDRGDQVRNPSTGGNSITVSSDIEVRSEPTSVNTASKGAIPKETRLITRETTNLERSNNVQIAEDPRSSALTESIVNSTRLQSPPITSRNAAGEMESNQFRGIAWKPNQQHEPMRLPYMRRERTRESPPPPPYESPRDNGLNRGTQEEYIQRLEDLLNQLLRREQVNQARPPLVSPVQLEASQMEARPVFEERRIQKAIHNWPFRYKGERDGASLNTFLQRVEIFALSEEIPEGVLLKNVKHLLQDDALSWYGNAYLRGELVSWEALKRMMRQEFLPSSYAYILRMEAYHRLQGEDESFSKFFQDISTLFQYVDPPMSEQEKLFIVKKNMNATYAPIASAQQACSMSRLVNACKEFDELRRLQEGQRRRTIYPSSLLEPSLATPAPQQRATRNSNPIIQRFPKVHAIEQCETNTYLPDTAEVKDPEIRAKEEERIDSRLDQLLQQVDALKLKFDRRDTLGNQLTSISSNRRDTQHGDNSSSRTAPLSCWNCDEEGHRFLDCPKPQAVIFCYRCGQKGFSLRNCSICRVRSGNASAGNQ